MRKDMDAATVVALVGILLGSQWLGTLINKLYDNWHKSKKEDPYEKLEKKLNDTHEELMKLAADLKANSGLTMAHARERLNDLMTEYKSQGFIPAEEYTAFILLGEAYIDAKGNHGFDIDFKWVVDNLPVK